MQDCRIFSLIAMILYLACPSAAADFMKGKVVMENGEAPPARVVIQRVCPGGAARPEALTNKQGIYVWPVAENLMVPCSLQAVLAGYVSSKIELSFERLYFSPELPAMTLHAVGEGAKADGSSPLSGAASKSWSLALKALTAKNWGEAERLLRITLQAVPNFAPAWNSLGAVCQYQQKTEDARDAYQHAVKLDPDLLTAYLNLTRLEIGSRHWSEASKDAESLIKADKSHHYLEAYLADAVARYALHDLDGAQATLNIALPLDKKHELPRLEYFMGAVLGAKGDREGGAEHLRKYLELEPKGGDARKVKTYLDNLTSANTAAVLPLPAETELLPAAVDANLPVVGDAWVPGGMKALAKLARLKVTPSYETFFLEYCRAISMETRRANTMSRPDAYIAGSNSRVSLL
jgi:tetratricopeptide (TPR) repeat protein